MLANEWDNICTIFHKLPAPQKKHYNKLACRRKKMLVSNPQYSDSTCTLREYYMTSWWYKISLRVLKNISQVSAANEWNIFQHKKRNFISPSSHGMFYLLLNINTNIIANHFRLIFFCYKRCDLLRNYSNGIGVYMDISCYAFKTCYTLTYTFFLVCDWNP